MNRIIYNVIKDAFYFYSMNFIILIAWQYRCKIVINYYNYSSVYPYNRQTEYPSMQSHMNRQSSKILPQRQASNPQTQIYNRHFYLRGAEHNLRQQQYQIEIKKLANKPKISPTSYNILCEQLEDRLHRSFMLCKSQSGLMDGRNQKQDLSKEKLDQIWVNFQQLMNIIEEFCKFDGSSESDLEHFLSQLWLILGQYTIKSEIKASLLYTTLRIFMDPYNLTQQEYFQMLNHIDQFKKAPQNLLKFLKQYPELRQETLTVELIIKLWKKIRYSNPNFSKAPQKQKNLQINKFPFKPLINKKSEYLASKSLKKYMSNHETALNKTLDPSLKQKRDQNSLSAYLDNSQTYQVQNSSNYFTKPTYHDILFHRKLEKDQISMKVPKEDSFQMSQVSRTARPQEIKQIVNNLYVVKQRKADTDFAKRDEQDQLKKCTFSPKINRGYYGSRSSVSPAVKGYEKQVKRLKKGIQQKQKKKQAYENLGRVKNFNRMYQKSPNRSIAPSFIDREAPKLILQINIDGGDRVEKLALKGNENPHLVSKKFCIMHGLQDQMIEVLEELVKEQLQNL